MRKCCVYNKNTIQLHVLSCICNNIVVFYYLFIRGDFDKSHASVTSHGLKRCRERVLQTRSRDEKRMIRVNLRLLLRHT